MSATRLSLDEAVTSARMQDIVSCLKAGGVIIAPTDTVYGLFCDALNPEALQRIVRIKGRPSGRPMPVAVQDLAAAAVLAAEIPILARSLASRFWPGALTLLLPAKAGLPAEIVSEGRVGVRAPDHAFVLAVLRALGRPLVATSANLTGGSQPASLDVIDSAVVNGVDWLVDGGPTRDERPSTVLDLVHTPPRIAREGAIDLQELTLALGQRIL